MNEQVDVAIFMEVCGQSIGHTPTIDKNDGQNKLYMNLITEEYNELVEAYDENDIVGVADACGDLIWVILGLCNTMGIPMRTVWKEIVDSNMSKTVDGKIIKRDDGKILKPDTYFSPNITRALQL